MEELFKRYKRVVLMYSGGKDSLAVLLLMKPFWDKLTVVFIDTDAHFPEVYEHMEKVKKLVHEFVVIKSHAPKYFLEHGFPVDVVLTRHSDVGFYLFGAKQFKCCSRFDCCKANIWAPMGKYFEVCPADCIILGDRAEERAEGVKETEGVHFERPIFGWTLEQVREQLKKDTDGLVEERHSLTHDSSLDCMHCTAYFEATPERMKYLKKHHPNVLKIHQDFYKDYKAAVSSEMAKLGDING